VSKDDALFAGRYRLGRLLGEGGMGKVYYAIQANLDREVAIKMVDADDDQPDALPRFQREARVAAALKHPNVVEIYDVGSDAEVAFLAMEFLRGTTLRDQMVDGVPMSLAETLMVAAQLSSALLAAHQMQVVHRDLKPENTFLETSHAGPPRVVVVDFGLAFIAGDSDRGRITRDGVVVGTPSYLSPEQAYAGHITEATDVYSFGAMLYEMLTGLPPFVGSDLNVLTQHLYVAPVSPSQRVPGLQLPRELEELVMSMLAKRPEDRPSIGEVDELLRLVEGTLSGRRARGRDARFLKDRRARMVSVATPRAETELPIPEAEAHEKRYVQLVGEVDFEFKLALASNAVVIVDADAEGESPPAEAVLLLSGDAKLVEAYSSSGMPVLASCPGDDMETLSSLARAGASDILTHPLSIDEVVRKLDRALRRAGRRRTKR
jgi:serine/threonine protein kinase